MVEAALPAAFDDHAQNYDRVAESQLGVELRDRVHRVLSDLLTPSASVIDLGCGTGLDASWLSSKVRSVAGFEPSAQMLTTARHRCAPCANVSLENAAARDAAAEPADLVLANFGVVNCVGDLISFAAHLRTLVKPSGHVVVVSLARWCPAELAIGLATLNRSLLMRRSPRHGSTTARNADYPDLQLRYASARTLERAFADDFVLAHAESLGLVLPPFEQRSWVENRTRLRTTLADLDRRLSSVGARSGLGDHHIAVFKPSSSC